MKNNIPKKTANALLLTIAALVLTACGGSDNDQQGQPPFAVAAVFGSGETTTGTVEVRSGSTVLLSGADSDDRTPGVPILTLDWQQIDNSGYQVDLYERNRGTSLFIAPFVPINDIQGVELEFELTVVDARDVRATDTVRVLVKPAHDDNHFLLNPTTVPAEKFILIVAAEAGSSVDTDIPFDVIMTKTAHWQDRSGRTNSLELDKTTFAGIVPARTALDRQPEDARNPFYQIPVPLLNVDEINSHFQAGGPPPGPSAPGADECDLTGGQGSGDEDERKGPRSCRLELEKVPGASIELSFELTQQVSGATLGLYLAEPDIDSTATETAFTLLTDTPRGNSSLDIDDESLRTSMGIESRRSANNYYRCIDPENKAATLQGWLDQAGFNADNAETVAHTSYLNNYDLNFGRDMFVRQDENSNVYSYVTNYPTLENIFSGRNEFAVVAMEFSPAPTGNCGDGTFDDSKKIVKFYAFVPDTLTGEHVRMPTMNFDGRGERSLPGVCVACHYGDTNTDEFNAATPGEIDASAADLDSSFMPWDLDSLLYTQSEDPQLTDPVYAANRTTIAEITAAFSL